ncbi:MAG: hypothetical protein ACI85U_002557, partial [Candidatus Promineifilaceae bacterium]
MTNEATLFVRQGKVAALQKVSEKHPGLGFQL